MTSLLHHWMAFAYDVVTAHLATARHTAPPCNHNASPPQCSTSHKDLQMLRLAFSTTLGDVLNDSRYRTLLLCNDYKIAFPFEYLLSLDRAQHRDTYNNKLDSYHFCIEICGVPMAHNGTQQLRM